MKIETSTEHVHSIVVTASEAEPFTLLARDDDTVVLVPQVAVNVTAFEDGALRPMQTEWVRSVARSPRAERRATASDASPVTT